MNTVRRVAKNTFVLLIAQIVSMSLGFFYVMYTARYLGAEGYGVLSFALAFTGMLGIFSDLGLKQLVVREVARDKTLATKYTGNTLLMKIILSVFTLFIIGISIHILNYPFQTIVVVLLIGMSIIIGQIYQLFYSIFQAFEKMEFQSIGQIISSMSLFIGAMVAIYFGYSIVAFALVYLVASLITFLYSLITMISLGKMAPLKYDHILWKYLIKEAFPFAITGLSISVYLWIDTLMLSLLKGNEVVGWYNAAYKLVLIFLFIPTIFNNSVFPLMSKYFLSSNDSLNLSFEKLFKSMVYIGLPLGVGTTFVADKVILLIYGSEFLNSVFILQILIWSSVLIFARSPFERLLESTNRQLLVTKVFIIGAIFNVITNLILIPEYSYVGAGSATVLTDFIVLILLGIYTHTLGFFNFKYKVFAVTKILVACGIMAVFLSYLPDFGLFIMIITGAIIYVISSVVIGVFDKNDLALIKSIFKDDKK